MPLSIQLPPPVAQLLQTLHAAGHSAYVVGGCVRDSLLGRTPGDWDLCTSALPGPIKALFAADRLLLAGEKHGTVAVVRGGRPYEITTYRLDGRYGDHRHPDAVRFMPDVRADLARRDFTINAMAYAPQEGLIDVFGGQRDLAAGRIRCVGDARARFGEDALRILRALRFAAQLDFTLDPATAEAALALRDSVQKISAERIFSELDRLLAGPAAGRVLESCGAILTGALPEVGPCIGCLQGAGHQGDVWRHTALAVGALRDPAPLPLDGRDACTVRWAVLLHDMAKPACRSVEQNGEVHFRTHNERGARQAAAVLARLKAPAWLAQGVPALIEVHDRPLPVRDASILRLLARYGPVFLRRLCAVKYADLAAHAPTPERAARERELARFAARMDVLARTGCYRVAQLKVDGSDALRAGARPGPQVGRALRGLLAAVMDGSLPNERAPQLAALQACFGAKTARKG